MPLVEQVHVAQIVSVKLLNDKVIFLKNNDTKPGIISHMLYAKHNKLC